VLDRLRKPADDIARFCFEKTLEYVKGRDSHKALITLAVMPSDITRTILGEIMGFGDDTLRRDQAIAELEHLSLLNRKGDRCGLSPLVKTYALASCSADTRKEYLTMAARCYSSYVRTNIRDERIRSARRFGYDAIEAERLNIFGLIDWCYDNQQWDLVVDLVLGLGYFPHARGYWADAVKYWQLGAYAAQLLGNAEAVARCTTYLGYMHYFQGEYDKAERCLRSVTLVLDLNQDTYQAASVMRLHAYVAKARGDYDEAGRIQQRCLAIMRQVKSPHGLTKILNDLGELAYNTGRYEEAERYLNESLAIAEANEDATEVTRAGRHLGELARLTGKFDEARVLYADSLRVAAEIGWRDEIAHITFGQARLEWVCGDRKLALSLAREVLDIYEQLGQNGKAAETRDQLSTWLECDQSG
jgi:LuxR family glucitol operon transcriptional activator